MAGGEVLDVYFGFHGQVSEIRWVKLDYTDDPAEQTFYIRNHEVPDGESRCGMIWVNRPSFHLL
jgi:hypothetical protein